MKKKHVELLQFLLHHAQRLPVGSWPPLYQFPRGL